MLARAKPYEQALEFIRNRPRECGIIYCFSRKSAESVAERLNSDGIRWIDTRLKEMGLA